MLRDGSPAAGPALLGGTIMRVSFIFLCGIVLPAFTLFFELFTSGCADLFLDPLPTGWHILLIGLIPLANLLVLLRVTDSARVPLSWLALINGMALGVAAVYGLVFLPLIPLGIIGILFCGLGLMLLAPPLAFGASLVGRGSLRRAASAQGATRLPRTWPGVVLGLVLLLAAEIPGLLTYAGAAMAVSSEPETRSRGLAWLRQVGSRDQMLRLCYHDSRSIHLSGAVCRWMAPLSAEQGQALFFRATGRPFNDFPPPQRPWARLSEGRFDTDRGGTEVARRVEGLALAHTRLEGQVEADAGLAYLEWTLVFRNDSQRQQEARAQVMLPPDGVVSRLTLWVNDEPREAAFSGTSQVRDAYEAIVRQRRDPVLVTASGPDRVLVQCFPVPPDGGTMKVRLGMTVPLQLRPEGSAHLSLPRIAEQNFAVPSETSRDVRIGADRPLEASGLQAEELGPRRFCLQGSVVEEHGKERAMAVRVGGPGPAARTWSPDPRTIGQLVVQEARPTRAAAAERLVVVIDGSIGMADHLDEVAQAVADLPRAVDLRVLAAADTVVDLSETARSDLRDRWRDVCGRGGCDNVPALLRGWELAQGSQSALVWVHAAQPVVLDSVEPFHELLSRRQRGMRFHDVPVCAGPNRVLQGLIGTTGVETRARTGSLAEDLGQLFDMLLARVDTWQVTRRRQAVQGSEEQGLRVSDHLARLWAREEVLTQLALEPPARAEAARLAASYQLVTPVSGAVVLETKEQFDRAGLQPAALEDVPQLSLKKGPFAHSGPEPAFWLVLLIVILVLLWEGRRRWKQYPDR